MSQRNVFAVVLITLLTISLGLLPISRAAQAQSPENRPPITAQNAASVAQLGMLDAGALYITTVAFSPDGKFLLSTDSNGVIDIWDLTTGKSISMKSPDPIWVNAAAYSPDGTQIASTNGNNIILWDVASQTQQFTLKGKSRVFSLVFSPDGKTLASGTADQTIQLWDVKTGRELNPITTKASVDSLAFSPDGTTLASTDGNTAGINFWEVASGKGLPGISIKDQYFHAVAYNKDGTRLTATGPGNKVYVWDAKTLKLVHSLEGHEDQVNDVVFSPNGSVLVSAGSDSSIRLWDVERGSGFSPLKKDLSLVKTVAFSGDGSLIASGSADGLILLWGLPEGGSLPLTPSEAFTPQSGHWEGSQNPIYVSFDVNTDGQIINFYWKRTIGTSYCTIDHKESLKVESNVFSLSPDGQTITGKFRSATNLFGMSPGSMRCGGMIMVTTGGPMTWWVKWVSK